jgi:GNAT superfamily N-acetyltransferase
MVAVVERKRRLYETFEPVMWKRAPGSRRWTRRFFAMQLLNRRAIALLATRDGEACGFLIARRIRVPPVFAPGGPTLFVDDFCVEPDTEWDAVGGPLLDALAPLAEERGYRQMLIVSGTADAPKMAFLERRGLSNASSWWTTAVGQPPPGP